MFEMKRMHDCIAPKKEQKPELSRSQKWNKKVKEEKATFEFVMEKDELAMLKEEAKMRGLSVTGMLNAAISKYIKDFPV